MIKSVFSVKNIKPGEPKAYHFWANSKVTINHFQLTKDQVSRVEVTKLKDIPDTIFITLYREDKEIGTVAAKESYILDLEVIEGTKYYDIRLLKAGDKK